MNLLVFNLVSRKAVSPLISVMLVLVFTVSISTVTLNWVTDYTKTTTQAATETATGSKGITYCANSNVDISNVNLKNQQITSNTSVSSGDTNYFDVSSILGTPTITFTGISSSISLVDDFSTSDNISSMTNITITDGVAKLSGGETTSKTWNSDSDWNTGTYTNTSTESDDLKLCWSGGFYCGWDYRKSINVSSTSVLTDYQVTLSVIWDFDMQDNFEDIRFTYYNTTSATETQISYWIESNYSQDNATVWFKTNLTSGDNTVYMYYGNATVITTSSSTPVILNDDFGTLYNVDGTNAASLGYTWTAYNGDPWGVDNYYLTNVPGQGIGYLEKDFGEIIPNKKLEVKYPVWGGSTSGVTATTQAWTGSSWVNIGTITSFNTGIYTYDIPEGTSKIKIWKVESHNNGLVINYWKFLPFTAATPPTSSFGVEETVPTTGTYLSNITTTSIPIGSVKPIWTSTEPNENINLTVDVSADQGLSWCVDVSNNTEYTSCGGIGSGLNLLFRINYSTNESAKTALLHELTVNYSTQQQIGEIISTNITSIPVQISWTGTKLENITMYVSNDNATWGSSITNPYITNSSWNSLYYKAVFVSDSGTPELDSVLVSAGGIMTKNPKVSINGNENISYVGTLSNGQTASLEIPSYNFTIGQNNITIYTDAGVVDYEISMNGLSAIVSNTGMNEATVKQVIVFKTDGSNCVLKSDETTFDVGDVFSVSGCPMACVEFLSIKAYTDCTGVFGEFSRRPSGC